MNRIIKKTLGFVDFWAKMEIMTTLVLTMIILGYAVFPQNNQNKTQLHQEVPSTVQP